MKETSQEGLGVDTITETKKCPKCKKILPLKFFSKSTKRSGGLAYQCKKCQSSYYVGRYKTKKDSYEFQCHEIIRKKKAYCRKEKISLGLNLEWMKEHMAQTHCAATGIEFEEGKSGPFSRSLDRICPNKGYMPDNTRVVARIYNTAKQDWPDSVVFQMAVALVDRKKIEKEN